MVEVKQIISVLTKAVDIGIEYYSLCLIIYLAMLIILSHKPRRLRYFVALLCAYCFVLLASTVLSSGTKSDSGKNIIPFVTYYKAIKSPRDSNGLDIEILINIIMMIPFGFLLSSVTDKNLTFTMIVGILFSVMLEALQYALHKGYCETDDVFSNTIGVIVGHGIYKSIVCLLKEKEKYF